MSNYRKNFGEIVKKKKVKEILKNEIVLYTTPSSKEAQCKSFNAFVTIFN